MAAHSRSEGAQRPTASCCHPSRLSPPLVQQGAAQSEKERTRRLEQARGECRGPQPARIDSSCRRRQRRRRPPAAATTGPRQPGGPRRRYTLICRPSDCRTIFCAAWWLGMEPKTGRRLVRVTTLLGVVLPAQLAGAAKKMPACCQALKVAPAFFAIDSLAGTRPCADPTQQPPHLRAHRSSVPPACSLARPPPPASPHARSPIRHIPCPRSFAPAAVSPPSPRSRALFRPERRPVPAPLAEGAQPGCAQGAVDARGG